MNKRKILKTLLVLWALQSTCTVAGMPQRLVVPWMNNPVYLDGDTTNSEEWIDANSVDLILGTNYGRSPPFLEARIWGKHNGVNLYLLYRIRFPYEKYDLRDKAFVYYLIPEGSGYLVSDMSIVSQLGHAQDLYNLSDTTWVNDVPGGENNVEGMGHFDGLFYWFEIMKPLNSGDGRDWLFEVGGTYGYSDSPIDESDHLVVGLIDESQEYQIQSFIQIELQPPPPGQVTPVGGEILENTPNIIPWLAARAALIIIAVLGVVAYSRRGA